MAQVCHAKGLCDAPGDCGRAIVAPVPALDEMTLTELRKRAIAHNAKLPKGHPNRTARAARLTKAEALRALAG